MDEMLCKIHHFFVITTISIEIMERMMKNLRPTLVFEIGSMMMKIPVKADKSTNKCIWPDWITQDLII